MTRWLLVLLLLASWAPGAEMVQSQSRHFSVYEPKRAIITGKLPPGAVALEPELLAITADRVRQAIIAQLPALGTSRERIHLHLMDDVSGAGVVGIVSTRFSDGWNYQLAIPPVVEKSRLIRALVQVLLLEYAQRNAQKGAELPAWAIEGMTQQVLHMIGPSLVVGGRGAGGWEGAVGDMVGRTREMLRTNMPPSFHDLTTLAPPPAGAAAEGFYQSCAHLLTRTLLQLPNGRQKFASFLQTLPLNWNWQTAFRQAFGFQKMLDVEKWWALVTVEFSTRDQRQAWSQPVSLQRLDEILTTRMQWRASQNSLPEPRLVELKNFLRDIEWSLQRGALREKIGRLGSIAPHLAPQIGGLAYEYKNVLQRYVRDRERPVKPGLRMTPEAAQQKLVADTVRRIEALDSRRKAMITPEMSSTRR